MIVYSARRPQDYLRWTGSVAPWCLSWAVPCALLAYLYHYAMHTADELGRLKVDPTTSETTGCDFGQPSLVKHRLHMKLRS